MEFSLCTAMNPILERLHKLAGLGHLDETGTRSVEISGYSPTQTLRFRGLVSMGGAFMPRTCFKISCIVDTIAVLCQTRPSNSIASFDTVVVRYSPFRFLHLRYLCKSNSPTIVLAMPTSQPRKMEDQLMSIGNTG